MSAEGNIAAKAALLKIIGDNAQDAKIAFGTATLTGSLTDINTGLSRIRCAVAVVKDNNQSAGDAAYVTVGYGADGLLDLYAWDDAGVAAANSAVVDWVAIGS